MARRGEQRDQDVPDEAAAGAPAGAARTDDGDATRMHDEAREGLDAAARALAENERRLQDSGRALRDRETMISRTGEMARELAERTEELRARTARAAELARRLPSPSVDEADLSTVERALDETDAA